jgi:hypothetical protein
MRFALSDNDYGYHVLLNFFKQNLQLIAANLPEIHQGLAIPPDGGRASAMLAAVDRLTDDAQSR